MSRKLFFENPDFRDYIELLNDLHALIREGSDETDQGEGIRDRMDGPASRLTREEVASVNGISADFYTLTDEPPAAILPRTAEVHSDLEEGLRARNLGNYNTALTLFRKCAPYLSPASLAAIEELIPSSR
jgi:hypothetical protein